MRKIYFITILFISLVSNAQVATTTPTGSSTEVGVTEGELSVSLTGSASYNIPIAVPPGINGVEPKIGLSYNSNTGNGIAGYGWNISGLSAITRIPSTKYHDNTNDPVDFDALDRFALDGQRLIVKNGTTGTYGANGTVYETEVFSNVKITSYGVHPSGANYGPAYFTVRYPDNSYAQYGYTTNSTSIATWAITHWVSPQNVRINFFYTLLDNNLYISSIKYGNGGTIPSLNEISFVYKSRTRREFVYVGGSAIQDKQIIEKINVIGNSEYIRNYLLEYQASSLNYDRLIKLTERAGNSTTIAYNPTVFEYEETSANNTLSNSQTSYIDQNLASSDYKYTVGDFDNDSKSDFIFYNKTNVNYNGTFILYKGLSPNISSNEGIQTSSGSNGTIIDAFTTKLIYQTPSQESKIFDKDTWTTIYKPFNFNNTTQPIKFKSYQYNNISNAVELIQEKSTSISNYESSYVKFLNGDFNGDKITDIILLTKENSNNFSNLKQVRFFDLKDNTSNFLLISGSVSILESIQQLIDVQVCDFNGDGKSDFAVFDTNGVRIYTLNLSNNSLTTLCTFSQSALLNKPHYLGDFNGDGNTDFVVPGNAYEDNWTFYISNGLNNFVTYSKSIGLEYLDYQVYNSEYGWNPQLGIVDHIIYQYVETQFVINDFDRDGKSDILKQQRKKTHHTKNIQTNIEDYSQQGQIRENYLEYAKNYYIDSAGQSYFGSQFIGGSNTGISDLGGLTIVTDIMKSSVYNLDFTYVQGNKIFSRTMAKNHKTETLLKSITTGNGVKETITYEPFTAESATESGISLPVSTISENYPNIDLKTIPSLMVVSKIEKQSASSYKKRFFLYSDAVSNVDGLGFLGFRNTLNSDWYDNNTNFSDAVFNTSKANISLRGAIEENKRFSINGTISGIPHFSKSIFTYNTSAEAILPNKVFKLKLNQSQELNGLTNTNIINENTYNDNNSLTTQVTTIENSTAQEEIRFTDIDYESLFTNESTYIVDRPTIKHKYNIYNANTIDESSSYELYAYNSNYLVSQIKTKTTNSGITTNYLTQDNEYDPYGNLTKKKITAIGLPSRETNYEYDQAYGYRFLTKSIDVDGLATEYTYNSSTGNLLTEKLPSNDGFPLTTTYTYDVWGKKTNTLNFLGNNQTVEYLKQNEKTLVTTTTIVADGNSVSTELLDDLGRKIQSGAKTLNGDMSYVDYEYDNFNRPTRVSEPYFGTAPSLWNQTSYDNYGRVNQTITATGKTTTITYDELTTTIDDGTKTKETVKNALGNVISLTETPGGTVTYEYFANGNLKSSTADGATTTIIQDGWGRKKELNDPAAGVYKYTYNDLGEITKEENPNGLTEYTYYPTGKLYTKWVKNAAQPTTTNIKSTYYYDDANTKLLTSIDVVNPNDGNNTFSYAYDDRRRLLSTSEEYTTIQPRTFSKNLTFDDYGRIATETVTASAFGKSTTKTTCNTYLNGFHNQIFHGATPTGTPVWKANTQDARGTTIEQTYGNGTFRSDQIDEYGYPVYTELKRAQFYLMQLSNVFDVPKGNLTNRTNSLFAWNEPFLYDTADRLTQYNNNLGQSITQDYFDSGKIQTNNLGTYNYTDAANPFKNTSLSSLSTEGQTFAGRNQAVTYNAFNSPIDITQANERVSFGYNALHQRSVMYYGNNVVDKFNRSLRKYYSADGSIEIKYTKATTTVPEKVEFFTYIGGDAYSAPLVVRKIDNGIYENFYLHRDHLGSILAITNSAGSIIEKRLFDAWGKILKIQNGSGATLTKLTFFDRGYTGHEHMQGVALINMNGRVYDPQLHRFLQPDNNVQDPFNTQNFNRYGYVLNNPLKYTDESGEFWGTVLSFLGQALLSSYVSTAQATGEGNIFKWDAQTWQSFGMNTASSTASYASTNYANSYIDNYNKNPQVKNPVEKDPTKDGYHNLEFDNRIGDNNSEILSRLNPDDKEDQLVHDFYEDAFFERNTLKWFSHGSNTGIGGGMTARQFDIYLKTNSEMYRLAIQNNTPITIKLYSCWVGTEGGLAQQFSQLHPNIKVWGANYTIVYSPINGMYIGNPAPNGQQIGNFNIYQNGELINTGNFKP